MRTAKWLFIILIWFGFVFLTVNMFKQHDGWDFRVYTRTAQAIQNNDRIYEDDIEAIDDPYLYPPLLAQALIPFNSWPIESVLDSWYLFNILLIGVSLYLIGHTLPPERRWFPWLLLPLFAPFIVTFLVGQVSVLLFALIVLHWYLWRRGHLYGQGRFSLWLPGSRYGPLYS